MKRFWVLAILLVAAGCGRGCGKKASPDRADTTKKPSAKTSPAQEEPAPTAVVGSVRLAPGHDLPSFVPAEMERQVLAHIKDTKLPDMCPPLKPEDRVPVKLTSDDKLIGVMLALSEFSRQPKAHTPQTRQVRIVDCRLTPSLVVAQIGDVLHLTNEVDFPFMPGFSSDQFSRTLMKGQSRDVPLTVGGVKILTCGFTAPCGRTDLIVMGHPYFAVTDDKGEFRIEGFPPDETVQLNAWHPLFEEAHMEVRVAAGETKRVELVLTPKEKPKPKPKVARDPNMILPE